MDLSWEALWQNHRRQLEDDAAVLYERAAETGDDYPNAKAAGIRHALALMDLAERHRGPIA